MQSENDSSKILISSNLFISDYMKFMLKLNLGDITIALTKLLIKHANLHTKETAIGA